MKNGVNETLSDLCKVTQPILTSWGQLAGWWVLEAGSGPRQSNPGAWVLTSPLASQSLKAGGHWAGNLTSRSATLKPTFLVAWRTPQLSSALNGSHTAPASTFDKCLSCSYFVLGLLVVLCIQQWTDKSLCLHGDDQLHTCYSTCGPKDQQLWHLLGVGLKYRQLNPSAAELASVF